MIGLLGWRHVFPYFERMFNLGPLLIPFFVFGLLMFIVILLGLQWLKRLLGFPTDGPLSGGTWTAADQNQFFAGEQVDRFTCQWRHGADWPGKATSRGSHFAERWRGR